MRLRVPRLVVVLVFVGCVLAMADSAVALESPRPAQFLAGGHVLGFGPDGVLVVGGDHMLKVAFGAARGVAPVSDQPPSTDDQAQPLGELTYPNLWPGVSVIYQQPAEGIVKSTYHLEPGADAGQIRLAYNVPVHLDDAGRLSFEFETGQMIESAPVAWQEIAGRRVFVEVSFRLISEREVGFALGAYNPAHPLVIDPTLTWNTFLGTDQDERGNGIAVDPWGDVYVTGSSPVTWGSPVNVHTGYYDAFAAKLNGVGGLVWNTFLGSSGYDQGLDVAADTTEKSIYVIGNSDATWGSPVRGFTGGNDVFVAKLSSNDGTLTWHTFLGSLGGDDRRGGIAVDVTGNVYVSGYSDAAWGAPVNGHSGGRDAFVAKLSGNDGTLTWNTFLGSSSGDESYGIAVDASGNAYVTGYSSALWGSPVRGFTGGADAFVAKLSGNDGTLTWNTFLGSTDGDDDEGFDIAVDGTGNVYVTGYSNATWGSPVTGYIAGDYDAFVAKLSSNDGTLTWNTFLGSSGYDIGEGITANSNGVYVAGYSDADWGSPANANSGDDAFVAKLSMNGTLIWNTFLGPKSYANDVEVAADGSSGICVAGTGRATWATPVTVNGFSGDLDAFVAVLADDPPGFVDDVEHGVNGWAATGVWAISEQACCPPPMPSPTHAWCFGRDGTLVGAGVLTSPVIDVSGLTSAEVGFWYCLDLLNRFSRVNAQAEVSIDGGAWQSVWTTTGAQRGTWTQVGPIAVALPPGSTELRLRYNVASSVGKGCFCIDDIGVMAGGVAIRRTLTVTSTGCSAIDVDGDGAADVAAGATGTFAYDDGTTVALEGLPGPCCRLDGWQVGGVPVAGNPIQVVMDADKTAVMTGTTVPAYTLTVTSNGCCPIDVDGDGGADVAPDATETFVVPCNASVTLEALAAGDCRFRDWTVNGQPMAGNPITFVMNEDKTAVAGCGSFFDDVESGSGGWTATGVWGISEQVCCPLPMPSPTHAWCFGTNGILGGAGVLTSPVINVSGLTSAEVGFWYCLDPLDFRSRVNAQAEVSIDGGAWQSVWTTTGAQKGAWTQVGPIAVPLPPGSTELRLRYTVTLSTGRGCFCIDDIGVMAGGVAIQRTLTVTSTGCSAIDVDGDGAADVAAGATGTFAYDDGTTVALEGLPGPCCRLDGWQVGGVPVAGNPIQVVMDADKTAVMTGTTVPAYTLTVTSNGCCPIDVDGDGGADVAPDATETFVVPCNASVTLEALAVGDCRFRRWTVNGQPMAGNPITFVMNEDKTAVAECGPFFDDVESGSGGWTATGRWAISEEACCPPPMPSPTHAWCFGTNGILGGAGVLTSPVIDVSGLTLAEVGFWYCLDLLNRFSRVNAQAEVSIDGGAWQSVWTTTGAQRGTWTQVGPIAVALPPGSTELRLRYNVTSSVGKGCFCIDDIAVAQSLVLGAVAILASDSPDSESFSEFRVDSVSNIPNPVTDIHTTRFEAKGVGIDEIRVMIYDQNGSPVFDSDWQLNGYNWHVETNDGETLANGVYLYKVMVRGVNGQVIVTETEKLAVYR